MNKITRLTTKQRKMYFITSMLLLFVSFTFTSCARKNSVQPGEGGDESSYQYETYFPNVDRSTLIDPRSVSDERSIGKTQVPVDTGVRIGSTTRIRANRYELEGVLRVITKTSVSLENFSYNGTCPGISIYLTRSNNDELKVVPLEIQNRSYSNESLTFNFPSGVTIDNINSVAMSCSDKEDLIFTETLD